MAITRLLLIKKRASVTLNGGGARGGKSKSSCIYNCTWGICYINRFVLGGIKFDSLSTHHCWAFSMSSISCLVIMTKKSKYIFFLLLPERIEGFIFTVACVFVSDNRCHTKRWTFCMDLAQNFGVFGTK